MPQPEPLSVDDALDRLVNQFSDSMAFFRELIQNALDAGSEEVEVWFEHRPGPTDDLMVIHVDDWGAGMNREIIDTRLTRLFSSSKDGDLTKIGKFGIGFVSVFAIAPQAVSIDTSRDGEHWRIVFDEQRRFSLIRRDEPVEGTKIEIYKPASASEFEAFRTRASEVVRYWCKHVSGEIRVDGELINEPFDLELPCKVSRGRDDEQVVVGHPRDGEAFAGFYNRGLTLVEEPMIPGIAFKASSAKLEHTLTRDDVIREAGFTRLMAAVNELIAGELCELVFAKLDAAIRELTPDPAASPDDEQREWLEYLWDAARFHEQADHAVPVSPNAALFRSPSGALVGWQAVRKPKRRRVIIARGPSPLAELLEREGATVVWLPEPWIRGRALLDALAPDTVRLEQWCTALPPRDTDEAVRWQILASEVARLLDDWGAKIGGVRLGHLDYAQSSVAERVAITQAEFGEATALDDAGELGTGLFASRRVVVLNADHPTIRTIAALAQTEPELGAYLAVKAFFLGSRLDAETDEKLATLTHDRRILRVGARA
ncbi:sacsin N-terminal ATP-binding-like domain-containing protein [Enhygromyxa salina]|uniref:sacsin N-terminal ATP-binding-like domain-containing protein n=1 Tax=Enhygromyxa salina TaxID=215803 RepID=UPI0011B22BDB|nr:ATP-binding protein [Enhygromyxa salina]